MTISIKEMKGLGFSVSFFLLLFTCVIKNHKMEFFWLKMGVAEKCHLFSENGSLRTSKNITE
jgi:hypothetical protein